MATNTLCQVSAEYEAYALQTSLMKGELDWRSGMKDAEKKGRNEGLIEGRNEGRNEGRSEGRSEGRNEVLELLKQGLSVNEIKERLEIDN